MKRIILAAIAAALMLPIAASAASSSTLHHREHRQHLTIHRDVGTLRFFRNHRWLAVTHAGRRALRFARAELGWTRREIRETHRALEPAAPAVSHLAGWSCITNGATPRSPHEGNGYNGQYVGPLGMTDPWLGQSSPGPDWHQTPVMVVYSIAEKVAAEHHFDPGFMRGQWPNTYPPCAGLF